MDRMHRERRQELYRIKVRKELDEMQYGRIQDGLPVASIAQPKRPLTIWAIAFAALLIGGLAIGQVL